MEEYFNSIKDYYSEKNDNTKCSNCQTNKNFLETTDELIFSCGGDGKCGTKLKIKLATYENVHEKINLLNHFLKENIYYDNLHKLYKIKSIINKDKIDKNIEDLHKNYIKQNDIVNKEKLIEDLQTKRTYIYKTKDLSNIKEYVKYNIEFNKYYNDVLNLLNSITDIIIINKPEVKIKQKSQPNTIENVDITTNVVPDIPKSTIAKKENTTDLKKGDYVRWISRNKFKYGIIKKINKKNAVILSNDTNEYPVNKKEIKIITIEEYEKNINLKTNLSIGDVVNWYSKDKKLLSGNVIKLNKITLLVKNKDNIEYSLKYEKIFL